MKLQTTLFTTFLGLSLCFMACGNSEQASSDDQTQQDTANHEATAMQTAEGNTATPSTNISAPVADDSYTFAQGRMGKAKIGMSKKDFYALYPNAKKDKFASEAEEIDAWVVLDEKGGKLFWALAEEGTKVTGFFTEHPQMQNPEKIHAGSSFSDFQKAYPKIEYSMAEGVSAKPNNIDYFSVMLDGVEVDFTENSGTNTKIEKASKDAKVRDIWVYK